MEQKLETVIFKTQILLAINKNERSLYIHTCIHKHMFVDDNDNTYRELQLKLDLEAVKMSQVLVRIQRSRVSVVY